MIRLLMALPLAIAVALGLFTFMAWMVDNGNHKAPDNKEPLAFNMVMVEKEQAPQRRQRVAPPPPETPEPPPEAKPPMSKMATASVQPVASVNSLGLDTAVTGIAINMPKFSDFSSAAAVVGEPSVGLSQQAMPLYRVEPRYPPRALKQGKEGYVVLKFTIDPQGRPIDISVVEAKPSRLFNKEAIRALRKWKYQPQEQNGTAVAQYGQTARIEFKLNQ
ncbi:energy transducer TonB [Photobacterium leiognathi]|uniref:Protein TonB n=1 Tax=Photobacterium leiognathi TaxID=553611 RepID=A0A2T3MF11_PHOLE|nr:energy transducer TonB [Photobacterium leiognathi]KJF95242.1 energy transducer TonB [Photobacterium leiognathi]PSV92387.1 energy transducer TonB [Photobacterium leiognathi]